MLAAPSRGEIEDRSAGERADRDVRQQRMQRMAQRRSAQKILQAALADNLLNRLRGCARRPVQALEGPELLGRSMQSHQHLPFVAFELVPRCDRARAGSRYGGSQCSRPTRGSSYLPDEKNGG